VSGGKRFQFPTEAEMQFGENQLQ